MAIADNESPRNTGIWYGNTTARNSEIGVVEKAVRNLGNLTMRVVDDPTEARGIVFDLKTAELRAKYPEAPQDVIDRFAGSEADRFVADMRPSQDNSQDPLRLIRVESTDGCPVSAHTISEEIKFRVGPGLDQGPITAGEVL